MRVPVNVIRAVVTLRPHPVSIVAQEDGGLCTLIEERVVHGIKHTCDTQSGLIVIPNDESVLSIQRPENSTALIQIHRSPKHVPTMPREITLSYDGVMASDQIFLHLLDIVVRPVAEPDHILVPVMFVRSIEFHAHPIVTLNTVQAVQ